MPDNYITLSQLTKTTKGLVNKINTELTATNSRIGDLTDLDTTAKTNLVAAINELAATSGSYDDTELVGRVEDLEDAISGLSGAMHFVGVAQSAITDGGTENPGIAGYSTKAAGDVVLYNSQEFVWTGVYWELLGDEGSYALKTVTVTGANGLTGGGALNSNQVISHATPSGASAGAKGSSTANNNTFLKTVTTDAYGHITASSTEALALATSSMIGGIKIGYSESGKNYAVKLSDGKAYVNVPWTDNNDNTTYTFAEGSTDGAFSVTPLGGSAQSVFVHGLAAAAYKGVETNDSSDTSGLVTLNKVNALIGSATGVDDSNFVHKTGQEVITGEKRFNGFIRTQGGRYVHICYPGDYSELGWYKFATIQLISGKSVGVPFCFIVSLVGQEQYTKVYVVFDPNDDSDPNLLHLTSEGLCEVAIHKSQTNYWDLYVKKEILSQSTLMVHDFISSSYGFNITWTREFVTILPEGAIECTHIPTAKDAYDYIDSATSGLGSAAYKDTGAVAADNTGLVTGGQVNTAITSAIGVLDVVPRRCSATLSSPGWYRAICYTGNSDDAANGYEGSQIDVFITRTSGANSPENHSISFHLIAGLLKFDNEHSVSNSQCIDKVRYTRNGNLGYIDIHYSVSTSNTVTVDFAVHAQPTRQAWYKAESLQAVADAPSGETVLTTYDLTADGIRTITLTSMNSAVTINSQSCKRIGNVVNLWVQFTVSSDLSGYEFLVSMPTPATNLMVPTFNDNRIISTTARIYADAGNIGLRCYDGIAAGTYVCSVSYITTAV